MPLLSNRPRVKPFPRRRPRPPPPQQQITQQTCDAGGGQEQVKDPVKEKERHAQAVAHTFEALKNHHRVYSVEILSHHGGDKDPKPPPDTITIKTGADGKEELHLGQHVVHNWNWDRNPTNTLTFKKGDLGGHIAFPHDESVHGFGTIRSALTSFSVKTTLKPVTYECAFSSDAGAYVREEGTALKLVWDASGDKWKNATWENNVLSFTYGIEESLFIGQKNYDVIVSFEDLQTKVTYNPAKGDFYFVLTAELQAVFEHANSIVPIPSNPRSDGKHVFPYQLEFTFNPVASGFDGAVLTKALDAATGEVYAVQAVVQKTVSGMFLMAAPNNENSLVEVSHGRLMVGNEAVPSSRQVGDKITWDSMPTHLAEATDLPPAGTLHFPENTTEVNLTAATESAVNPDTNVTGSALRAFQPTSFVALASSTTLSGEDLLSMSQFKQDGNGKYYDYILRESMQDFYTIIQYYMDSELREWYMGMRNPPSLDPTVKQIADTNGSPTDEQKANGDDGVASTWYKTLSVAYLTQVLPPAFPSDDYAGKLNTIRAKQWLKTETSTSSVYTVQSSDLYKNRWMENIPLTGQYIVDQLQNKTTYNTHIDQDKSTWEAEIEVTVVDSDNLTAMKSIIEEINRLGKQGKYWAYWLFRDLTQPSALQMDQVLSIGGAASLDGSAFSRRIQQNCAMLGILDSSTDLQEQYVKVMQVFLLTNIVPLLLDFSGDMTHYTYAVMEILQAFQDKYIGSTDPQMQDAARQIQDNMTKQAVEDLLSVLQVSAEQMATDYSLFKLLYTVDGLLYEVPLGKVLGRFVIGAALSAGIMMFYFGVIDWSQLSTTDKVQVVSEGAVLFTEVAGAMVKRGASIYELWGTDFMGFKNAGKILMTGDCQESMIRASNGLSKWLMQRKGQVEVGVNTAAASEEAIVAGEEDMTLMQNLFGRNLDEFVATRFGAAVAILGLVYGSISHSRSHSKVGNALGVTASALQLTATMGAWLLPETMEGIEAATILSTSGSLATAAAIAGVIIYIIVIEEFRETPIEYFAKHQASAAGLYMEHGADIDSFQKYQPTGELEKEGVSLLMGGSSSQYMKFSLDGTLALAETTNGPDTVFYLITDAYGRAKFIANLPNADNTAIESKVLTIDGTGSLSGASLLTGSSADQQLWVAECQGSVNRDSDDHLQSASFKFYSYYWYKNHSKKYYLGGSNNVPSASESNQQDWTVSMASTKPVGVSMDNIILYTYQKDETFQPTLLNPGSDPKTWSISPALPDFMELDTATGAVSQKSGTAATVTASDTYTLTVTNELGSSSTTFTFEVKVLVF
ncbi:uncharacterized protein LOC118425316 [Branchiostoma floridae]|uniref:Uncharacterized protein LOC118425316 n=1 Tax=Branchiostoma floridae TaxID=7739 RepID=A0A9J7N582_BRAFL|nr:uncharacterized protein LOC118425316 [Branchiostoma floridae]